MGARSRRRNRSERQAARLPLSILWIDDEAPHATVLRFLSSQGFHVTAAASGATGLELGRSHPYDGVIVDLHLPDVHGLSVVERLRAAGVSCPIMAVTGYYLGAEAPQHARAAGATAFKYKPLWLDDLPSLLRELTASPASQVTAPSTPPIPEDGDFAFGNTGPGEPVVALLLARLDRLAAVAHESPEEPSRDVLLRVLLSALSDPALSLTAFRGCADALRAIVTAPSDTRTANLAARARDELRESTRHPLHASHPAVRETLASLVDKPRWRQEEDVAAELGLSRGHFARLAREHLDADYRTLRRLATMKAGVVEILNSGEQVGQIAHQLDVPPAQFDHVFAETFGCCPRELRRIWNRLR